MVFLAGPRQVGKTFIAQQYLKEESSLKLYYNWDLPETAKRFRDNPIFFELDARSLKIKRPTIVFDEFHKRSRWKNELKGIYDKYIESLNIIVTGSARLDLLRQTGESLAGRYFLYRLFPLSLQEYSQKISYKWDFRYFKDILGKLSSFSVKSKETEDLLRLGGFPDPLTHGTEEYRRKWAMDYQRLILKEDLKDLSRIQELDRVETLWALLPSRVGSPLSVSSLREDLSASHEAVRTWLLNLEKMYSIFFLSPYSKKISRAVKKERKVYLMDWALHDDESKRFENFIISSLYRSIAVWNDLGAGNFELYFIRNVFGKEADFLIVKDGQPWLLGDIKLSDLSVDSHLYKMANDLGKIPIIQIVKKSGVFKVVSDQCVIVSADRFLLLFP